MEREVCAELPPEDPNRDGGANVGYLLPAMYGLREAPAIWQAVIQGLMADLSFEGNVMTPACFIIQQSMWWRSRMWTTSWRAATSASYLSFARSFSSAPNTRARC